MNSNPIPHQQPVVSPVYSYFSCKRTCKSKCRIVPGSTSLLTTNLQKYSILLSTLLLLLYAFYFYTQTPVTVPKILKTVQSQSRQEEATTEVGSFDSTGAGGEAKISMVLTERQVFAEQNNSDYLHLEQNDSRLLKYVRENHFWQPLPQPYKLKYLTNDPTTREGQNKVVLQLLNNKRNGFFIEAGANDGEFLSNTLVLERDYGWTGILVEPDQTAFNILKTKNRKAWLSDVCLSVNQRPEKVKFIQYKKTSTWSKIEKISNHDKNWAASLKKEVEAKCIPFYSLILAINMTTIDYFSLDVEGAELAILKTIPFKSVLIRTLSIEFDHIRVTPGADAELKHLMESNDYKLVTEISRGDARDYIYAHKTVVESEVRE